MERDGTDNAPPQAENGDMNIDSNRIQKQERERTLEEC